jgi:2-polyprenyl-3-methyl-5-hydroxy-6-metoxy-1,4-benzoquinol methylase
MYFYDNSTNKVLTLEEFNNIKTQVMTEIQKFKETNTHILKHYIENLPYVPLRNFQDIECIYYEGFSKSWKTWDKIKSFVDWKDKTIVDVGPFHGYFSFKAEQAGAKKVYGLEIDPAILETANIIKKIIQSKAEFSLWDGTTPTPQADIALVLNVFHHVKDKELLLQNIKAKTAIFEVKEQQMELVKKYFNILKQEKSHRIDLDTNLYRHVILGEKK